MEYEKDSGFGFNDNSTASSLSNDGYNNFLSSDPASHDSKTRFYLYSTQWIDMIDYFRSILLSVQRQFKIN